MNKNPSDGLGDWRIATVTTLVKDLPPAFYGGPSHKAGTPVYQASRGFVRPSSVAMALNIATAASIRAEEMKSKLKSVEILGPDGVEMAVS